MIEITEKSATPAPGIPRRLASMVYELLLIVALLFVASLIYIQFRDPQAPGGMIFYQVYLLGVLAAYFFWFWTHGGRTLAMKTWRLRVADQHGGPVSAGQALLRFIVALLGIGCFGVGILWALFDPEGQFLHDRIAGTRLIWTK